MGTPKYIQVLTPDSCGCEHVWGKVFVDGMGFPGGSVVKNPPANEGDMSDVGFFPWVRKIPGIENGNLLQYSCLENSMDRGAGCQCRRQKRCEFDPWVMKFLWRRAWQPTPVFLPGKCH